MNSKYYSPVISVIMAVYNGERHVARALMSILAQTFTNFEVIIVDDGSKDNTFRIINSIKDRRITLIQHDNVGLTKSLNEALFIARGKWIARHDADDFSISTRFEDQINFLERNPDVGLLGSNCFIQPEKHGIVNEVYVYPEQYSQILAAFASFNPFVHGSMVIDKRLLIDHGGYNESYRYVQDYELWSRLILHTHAHNLPTPLYVRTVHNDCSESTVEKQSIFNEIRDNYLRANRQHFTSKYIPCKSIQSISIYPAITLRNSWNKSISKSYYRMSNELKKHNLPWIGMRMQSVIHFPWSFGVSD
jgi:glycosyltransferase involved in cell wall biosynthesis